MRRSITAAVAALLVSGCASDGADPVNTAILDTTLASQSTRPPTACVTTDADPDRTVTIRVNDESDAFGAFGTATPDGLSAGAVRLVVDAHEDNPAPVDVDVFDAADDAVFQFVAVQPGERCGADVDLAAGTYVVVFGDQEKSFAVR